MSDAPGAREAPDVPSKRDARDDAAADAGGAGWLWSGTGVAARAARGVLAPLSLAYRGAMAVRGRLYGAGVLRSHPPPIPAISIGNITVGGTGKTPVAAWVAGELAERGAHPAVVLRGYGADEPLVHQRLHPTIPVVVDPDRVAGIERAAAGGADVAVLDDAFQHLRARRTADVVLVSADAWVPRQRMLPAGPWREPLSALRRADLVVVTRKSASEERARAAEDAVRRAAPGVPCARLRLALRALVRADGQEVMPLSALPGRRLFVVSAIADPAAFLRQMSATGAVLRARSYADHYRFARDDVRRLCEAAAPGELVVCTLKDAVKLVPLWPRAGAPLWYVSQHVIIESGEGAMRTLLDATLRARHPEP